MACKACDDGYYWNSEKWTCDKCLIEYCLKCVTSKICELCEDNLV